MELKEYYKNFIRTVLLERIGTVPKAKMDAFKASSSHQADVMRNREEDHLLTHSPLKRRLRFRK